MQSKFNHLKKEEITKLTGNEKTVLKILLRDSTTSDVEIGKRLKISSQAVNKIIKKLKIKGIIKNYTTELDYSRLGIHAFALALLEIHPLYIEKYFHNKKSILKNSIGFYKVFKNDITHIALFAFKNLDELEEYFDFLHSEHSKYIKIKNIYTFPINSFLKHSPNNLFYYNIKEFGKENMPALPILNYHLEEKKKNKVEKLSTNEKSILKLLIKNSRISRKKMALNLNDSNITNGSISKIKRRLENKGVINGYSIRLDYEKLGLNILSFLFINKKTSYWKLKDGLYKWAAESPNVIGCYKLNENSLHILLCGFRNLKELENYCYRLQSQNKDLFEIDKIYIAMPEGVLQDSPLDLFYGVLE